MHVLLVKMSSLGDVVHTLPALSDAAEHGVTFDWVVEENFSAIAELHPAVKRVIPIGWRRWRKHLIADRAEIRMFLRNLRKMQYARVLDAQGLLKSAAVTLLADAQSSTGLSRASAREGAASIFYNQRFDVAKGQHAVDRLRQLFAAAFDYGLGGRSLNFGLEAVARQTHPVRRRCVLLHGTTWNSKLWPESMWCDLATRLLAEGFEVQLPWGDERERERAGRIAQAANGAQVLDALSLAALIKVLAASALVVGVDSGLTHLAGALGVKTLVLYGSTDAILTGARGDATVNLQSDFSCSPCMRRDCGYRGEPQLSNGAVIVPPCFSRLPSDRVWQSLTRMLED